MKTAQKKTATVEKIDIYEKITNQVIDMMEAGHMPWENPVVGAAVLMPKRVTKQRYQGANAFILMMCQQSMGYKSAYWMTFRQAQELGGNVRKGEKGTQITYYRTLEKESTNDEGEKEIDKIPMLKTYYVFNLDQIENLSDKVLAKFVTEQPKEVNPDAKDPEIEQWMNSRGVNVDVSMKGCGFYRLETDTVHMPEFAHYVNAKAYYGTFAHELVHATGAKNRLNRTMNPDRNSADYAREELIAELGAVFTCAALGIASEPDKNNAAYLKAWLAAMKQDKRYLFKVLSEAGKASEYLLNYGIVASEFEEIEND